MPSLRDVVMDRARRVAGAPEVERTASIAAALVVARDAGADDVTIVKRGRFVGTVRAADLDALVRAERLDRLLD